MTDYKRKLIEVALPLEAINKESAREKSIRHGHPSTLHLWWARRPLAACRAVLFASLVDDPSAHPDRFPTEAAQETERKRLFGIIEELVRWDNANDERVLSLAKIEIANSCGGQVPPLLDPFCGGGSIPLEAQRLGLESYASDLNPVAVLITKALIEIPPKFSGRAPANPDAQSRSLGGWTRAQGLAADVRYYGLWMRAEAQRRIGHLYPKVKLPPDQGGDATIVAWLWARTVKCPNPACGRTMPLLSSLELSSRPGRKRFLRVSVLDGSLTFDVSTIPPVGIDPKKGYKRGVSGIFACAHCGTVTTRDYVSREGQAGRLGMINTAVVAEGVGGRVYLSPSAVPAVPKPSAELLRGLDVELAANPRDVWCRNFGLMEPKDLFTNRQLVALMTFSDLVGEAREGVIVDAVAAGMADDGVRLAEGGTGATAYADAIATYLAFGLSKASSRNCTLAIWESGMDRLAGAFGRQALPMTWDFAETNPLAGAGGDIAGTVASVSEVVERLGYQPGGHARQQDAATASNGPSALVFTDPPYYDNIGYADLADFFYVWLRRSLNTVFPDLLGTLLTPKNDEIVALPYRFGGDKKAAEQHFEAGLARAFDSIRKTQLAGYPMCVYYAFQQSESNSDDEVASTGWETMLSALLNAGFAINGTWPVRSELTGALKASINALASSVVLVCRPRSESAPLATRKDFLSALQEELPGALRRLQQGNIAPVDLAQAAIGPGMAAFSRFAKVVEADGSGMRVRTALGMINKVLDETLAEQEADFDADTRWAVAWFEQFGMSSGDFGVAETLSRAKNSAVNALEDAGIIHAGAGKVRLLERDELGADWDPATDRRLTVWEVTQHLIRALESGGETGAAELVGRVGGLAETARELAYRLYNICERKRWAKDGFSYNGLVVAWPAILRISAEQSGQAVQLSLEG